MFPFVSGRLRTVGLGLRGLVLLLLGRSSLASCGGSCLLLLLVFLPHVLDLLRIVDHLLPGLITV